MHLASNKSLIICFTQINAQAMQNALSPDTQPWVTLGRQMGTILAAMGADAKNSLTITAYGRRPSSLASFEH